MDLLQINIESGHGGARQTAAGAMAPPPPRRPPEREPEQRAPEPARRNLGEAVKRLAAHFKLNVEVAESETTGRSVVRIMSPDGRRLLRQLPPEEVLKMADQARLGSLRGLLTFMA